MIKNTFKIVRKEGWELNPDDDVVNHIIEMLEANYGHCPCVHPEREGHDQCPCTMYIANNVCYCGLYVKLEDLKLKED